MAGLHQGQSLARREGMTDLGPQADRRLMIPDLEKQPFGVLRRVKMRTTSTPYP